MKVIYYKKRSNKEVVKDFINKLQKKDRQKIFDCLDDIEEKENFDKVKGTVFRQIDGKLWEIKIKTSAGGYRIFYTMLTSELMVLLHAYKKQSQKAPQKELDIARKRMKEVQETLNIKQ